MAKIHDKFVIELAEVIKGYGNDPDVDDPFHLSKFYRFYELPNIAVSRENFEKMRPVEPQRMGNWKAISRANTTASGFGISISHFYKCDMCGYMSKARTPFCPNCGCRMTEDTP